MMEKKYRLERVDYLLLQNPVLERGLTIAPVIAAGTWAETRLLFPLITLETVIMLTPALSAISFKVGFSMQFIPFLKIFQSKPIIKEYKKEIKEFINFYDLG